jgi:hypothetical protein
MTIKWRTRKFNTEITAEPNEMRRRYNRRRSHLYYCLYIVQLLLNLLKYKIHLQWCTIRIINYNKWGEGLKIMNRVWVRCNSIMLYNYIYLDTDRGIPIRGIVYCLLRFYQCVKEICYLPWWWRQWVFPTCQSPPIRLHDFTAQKAVWSISSPSWKHEEFYGNIAQFQKKEGDWRL